jgi:oligoendopeptidase F
MTKKLQKRKIYDWNLSPLFSGDDDPKISVLRKQSLKASDNFIKKWKSRTDYMERPSVLKEALDEYSEWIRDFGALHTESYYFHLRHSQNQVDPKIKAGMNKTEELAKKIENNMNFFELNLAKIKTSKQNKLLKVKNLLPYKHFLERIFAMSSHLLSESEEKIMNLKSTSAYDNWVKMVSGFLSKEITRTLNEKGEAVNTSFSELLGLMNSQKKNVRDSASLAFNQILEKHVDVATEEINSILQDKKVNDQLRGFEKPYSSRLLSDDIDESVVNNLITAVSGKFSISQRFYKLKSKLLGVTKLEYHERNVEYGKIDKNYSFSDGTKIVNRTFDSLDKEFADLQSKFVQQGRVDVYPKVGKSGGAFCTSGLITHPVYILLNWNNKLNDVLTFAHELGHGINDELIKKTQNALNFGTPISTAEVASTFMEDFVLQELLKEADDELKLSLMMMKLNEDISTIFRQIAFFKFENELHTTYRTVGYLSKDKIGKIFQKHMASYMGEGVIQSKGSENWWVYWNHLRYFFYVYSYASGLLISKSLQGLVKTDPKFIDKVKIFLSTGLSESPKDIFAKMGIDIIKKDFWELGLNEITKLLEDTEVLARKMGKI